MARKKYQMEFRWFQKWCWGISTDYKRRYCEALFNEESPQCIESNCPAIKRLKQLPKDK